MLHKLEILITKLDDEGKSELAIRRSINKFFRTHDESHLWPIWGRSNATERAIRRVNKLERAGGAIYGLEYAYAIDAEISNIVNHAF